MTPGYGRKSVKHKYVQIGSYGDFHLFFSETKKKSLSDELIWVPKFKLWLSILIKVFTMYMPNYQKVACVLMRIKSPISH